MQSEQQPLQYPKRRDDAALIAQSALFAKSSPIFAETPPKGPAQLVRLQRSSPVEPPLILVPLGQKRRCPIRISLLASSNELSMYSENHSSNSSQSKSITLSSPRNVISNTNITPLKKPSSYTIFKKWPPEPINTICDGYQYEPSGLQNTAPFTDLSL